MPEREPIVVSRIIPREVNSGLLDSRATPGETTRGWYTADGAGMEAQNLPAGTSQKTHSGKCGSWAIMTECSGEQAHKFVKRLVCGLEWCPECGKDGSPAHLRRIARWLPKARQIRDMGYLVIEFPDDFRMSLLNKDLLKVMADKTIKVLAGKRMGRRGRVGGYFSRGLLRWHWFGDICTHEKRKSDNLVVCKLSGKVCPNKHKTECPKFVNSGKFNPHLNILVDGEYLDNLDDIKQSLRAGLGVPDLIVRYNYCDTPAQKYHKVRYITRATFTNYDWSPELADVLYKFRNIRWWGKWDGGPEWDIHRVDDEQADIKALEALEKLGSGICPICGSPLCKWTKAFNSTYIEIWQAEEIGNTGYYTIPDRQFSGVELTPDEILRLDRIKPEKHDLKHSIGGHYVPSMVADVRWSEFLAQHRRFIDNYKWWNEVEPLYEDEDMS